MNYEQFNKIITEYQNFTKDIFELSDLGFDFFEGKYKLILPVENILQTSLESIYTEEGIDWINWFIYESDFGTKDWSKYSNEPNHDGYGAHDSEGNPICHTIEDLFNHIEQYKHVKEPAKV
jgi:hypothetical protein